VAAWQSTSPAGRIPRSIRHRLLLRCFSACWHRRQTRSAPSVQHRTPVLPALLMLACLLVWARLLRLQRFAGHQAALLRFWPP
jgi:hypothetical protein